MNPLALVRWKWVAGVALCAAALIGAYVHGASDVQDEWDKDKSARKVSEHGALIKRQDDNAQLVRQHEAEKQALRSGYETEIVGLHDTYIKSGRLRVATAICSGVAPTRESKSPAGGDAEVAGERVLPESYDRDIKELMLEADTLVEQYRVLEEFVLQNGMGP